MKTYQRRHFLQLLGSGLVAGLSPIAGLPLISAAKASPSPAVMVVLFQRGGCDGLNMLVPIGGKDDAIHDPTSDWSLYTKHRPTLYISEPLPINDPSHITNPEFLAGTKFGLHPAMSALQLTIDEGNLTFFPATHTNIDLRPTSEGGGDIAGNMSHFSGQQIIESGGYGNDLLQLKQRISDAGLEPGWIARLLGASANETDIVPFGFGAADSLKGDSSFLILRDLLSNGQLDQALQDLIESRNLERRSADNDICLPINQAECDLRDVIDQTARAAQINAMLKTEKAQQAYAAETPNSSGEYDANNLGNQLKQAATLIKGVDELQFITITQGGYDDHARMNERHNNSLGALARNLAAFRQDLIAVSKPVEVVVLTEFGRTVDENGKKGLASDVVGTDHGQAFCAMVMGAGGAGGSYLKSKQICYGKRNNFDGTWPGLINLIEPIANRHHLNAITDYRDILVEILDARTTANGEEVFRGPSANIDDFYFKQALGFL